MNYLIKTERLGLRPFTLEDAPFFLSMHTDPQYLRFIPDRGIRTIENARAFLEQRIIPSYAENGFGFYRVSLLDDDTPVGMTGFVKRDGLDHVDIGYGFLSEYYGRGFATETTRAVMDYARHELDILPIVAIAEPENVASVRILEKIGLYYDGMIDLGEGDLVGYYVPQELLGAREKEG